MGSKWLYELVMDEELLKLRPINLFTVSRYRQAMRQGAAFPPLLIEVDTNRIISGNHRYQAILEEYGESAKVECKPIGPFETEADAIKKFTEENITHGEPLSGISRHKITRRLLDLDVSPGDIAKLLNCSEQKIKKIGNMTVVVVGKGKRECVPIKHGLEHLAGEQVKQKVYDEHIKKDLGIPLDKTISQLLRWIRNDWVDREDEVTVKLLYKLHEELDKYLGGTE